MSDVVNEWLFGQIQPPGPGHRSESRAKARQKVGLQVVRRIQPNGLPPTGWTNRETLFMEVDGFIVRLPGF